jgi:hypothetical protein
MTTDTSLAIVHFYVLAMIALPAAFIIKMLIKRL